MSAALAPYPWLQFMDGNGTPYPNALLYTYIAGTSTPLATYSDSDLSVANSNPVVADADGIFPAIYLSPLNGYKFILKDEDDVTIRTRDNILAPGDYFAGNFGTALQEGARDVTSGYTVTATDRLVTVASTGGPSPCIINLPAVSTRTQVVIIKNMGTVALSIVPNGSDTIDEVAAAFALEAAATPLFPCVWLDPSTGGWYIVASHRAA